MAKIEPTPPELFEKFEFDCRPGPSKYPKGSSARIDAAFEKMVGRKPGRVADKLSPKLPTGENHS